MSIHKEGYLILIITIIILGLINFAIQHFFPENKISHNVAYLTTGILFLLVLQFFRSPDREIVIDSNKIYAPADGTVVIIEDVEEPEYFQGKRKQVSIFMSPLNAHVNWYPIGGIVKYFKYHPGDYLVAWHPKSSTLNERTTLVIEDEKNREVMVRQIAGAVARRIVSYSEEGDTVIQGNQLGFIKFGSRLDLYLPTDAKILVELDESVRGCRTVVAEF